MCEGLALPWDCILLMVLIYMAYDISYINETPHPSLPSHSHFLNSTTRPQSKLVLNVLRGTALLLPGPEGDGRTQGWHSDGWPCPGSPRATTAGGCSAPLGLAQEGPELTLCHFGDIWFEKESFCPGSFLLCRLKRYPVGRSAGNLSLGRMASPGGKAAAGLLWGALLPPLSLTQDRQCPCRGAPVWPPSGQKALRNQPFHFLLPTRC